MSWLLQWIGLGRHPFLVTQAGGAAPSFLLLADGTSKILLANATDRLLRAE